MLQRCKSDLASERCNVQKDHQALSILNKCGGIRGRTPVEVPGDGDYFFHSLSVTLCGNTSLSTELRVRCCIELMKKKTQSPPIMLSPIYLHWAGSEIVYHDSFFSHLQAKLGLSINIASIGHNNLVLGSDEEKALTNAIQSVFPNSTLVLCHKTLIFFLEENVKRYIQAKSGSEMLKHRIVSDIFGTNGLLYANDATHFDAESNRLLETYLELIPDFVNYFKTKLVPLSKKHVFLPNKKTSSYHLI